MGLRKLRSHIPKHRVPGGQGGPQQAKFHQPETLSRSTDRHSSAGLPLAGSSMTRDRSAAIPKSAFSAPLLALFFLLALVGLSGVPVRAQSASTFYKQGQSAEQQED